MIEADLCFPVSIVGTGPGDPDLLTVRALRIIRNADVIFYDCRSAESALQIALPSASIMFVERDASEETAMSMLIRKFYLEGKKVVRLRVGDPMLFGSAVDDCSMLNQMGVPYEVVPGISAGTAAACSYALPVSEKYQSDSVTHLIVNDSTEHDALVRDAASLLRHGSTIVLYMATANLEAISGIFLEQGVSAAMPVIAVSRSCRHDETCVTATVGDIAALKASGKLLEPVVYFVGQHLTIRNLPVEKRLSAELLSGYSGI